MLFKTILINLFLYISFSQQFGNYIYAQEGAQYSVRFDNPSLVVVYDFTMPEKGILYGQIQNPNKLDGVFYTTYLNNKRKSTGDLDFLTTQSDYFFKGKLKRGENVRLEIIITWYDGPYFENDLDYSIVSFVTHSKQQKENFINRDRNVDSIKVYGPLAARTQLYKGPINQRIFQYGAVSKYCFYQKLTPEQQRKGSLHVVLSAKEREYDDYTLSWESFAVAYGSVSRNQIDNSRSWPQISHTENNEYTDDYLRIHVKELGGFKHEYLALSVYVDTIFQQYNLYSFDIEIEFHNNNFLE